MYPSTDAPVRRRNGGLAGHGLGIAPLAVAQAAPTVISTITSIFGGKASPRSGGADPCCQPEWGSILVRNRNVDGAPPDFRDLGQPSPSGVGRLKDDACDCVPIEWPRGSGRFWMLDGSPTFSWREVTPMLAPLPPGAPPPPPPGVPPPPRPPGEGLDVVKLLPLAAGAFLLLRGK